MKTLTWYFDFISPFAYLQRFHLHEFAEYADIKPVPVLLAGLLNHWGSIGPAEIPAKRIFSYRHVLWQARSRGIKMTMPKAHPFVPLLPLRLCIALDNDMQVIERIFDYIWGEGRLPDEAEAWTSLLQELGVQGPLEELITDRVKEQLKDNTATAAASGLFGVPTTVVDDQVFWGVDSTGMVLDYLRDPEIFNDADMRRIDTLPVAANRK